MDKLKIKLTRPSAVLPARATLGSGGYDLCACLEAPVTIGHGQIEKIPTGVAIELPSPAYVALVFGRSGLGVKHGIVPANAVGVIDSDYRGEIFVGLVNQSQTPYTLQPGERIAQLAVVPVFTPELEICDELGDTQRGAGGFGSTGN